MASRKLFPRVCYALAIWAIAAGSSLAQTGGASSAEDLASRALAAIESKDKAALEKLTVTEEEFKLYIWPTTHPASMGPQSKPAGAYQALRQASAAGIEQRIAEYGGRKLKVVRIAFGPERKLKDGRILQAPEITASGEEAGEVKFRIAASVLEHGGEFKFVSFFYPPQSK